MNTAITFSNESPKVFFKDGRLVTTSQAVADYFDKQHKHVLAKIDTLDCLPNLHQPTFRPMFRLSKLATAQNVNHDVT